MLPYSKSVNLAWQIAASEAASAQFQFIEIEHIFIGILRTGDVLDEAYRKQNRIEISDADLEIYQKGFAPILELLEEFEIDKVKLRRHVRGLVGKGDYKSTEKVIHRSERCKALFSRADAITRKRNNTSSDLIHLLEAIIDKPGSIIEKAFSNLAIDPNSIKNVLSGSEKIGAAAKSKTGVLDKFGLDLTRSAREGKSEPLIGRKEELLKVVRTLTRKIKSNPVLIGEAGVGKTAIVKGLALRIAQNKIVPQLQSKRIIELNIAGIIAGTKYRGEFEEKLLKILEAAKSDENVILFIDEIHTIVGAGSTGGNALDAANIMKPMLAGGELRCIGATTIDEYRKYFEKDPALERRFQPVMVNEPTEADTISILNGLKERFEVHHKVTITDDAINAAVRLSIKHIRDRQLPDKAIDIIDEACSRVKVENVSYYGGIQDIPVQNFIVTEDVVFKVVSDWSGVPVEKPDKGERERLARLEDGLSKRVVGQSDAIKKVSKVIKIARAGLRDPKKPFGVFLFLGPTGVGKTELAKALAAYLFDSEDALIRFDMSEYMEKHSVAKLIGSPPGYVGYEEEGQLTGKLRTKPYSVILFDEVEKAHPEVLDIFLQVFDEGRLTDTKGRTVDGSNAIFIMTSNIEPEHYQKKHIGFGTPGQKEIERFEIKSSLKGIFRPEFLNRIDEIVQFGNLDQEDVGKIVSIMLEKLKGRLKAQNIAIEFTDEAVEFLSEKGYDSQFGARPIARTIEQMVTMPVSEKILSGDIKTGDKISIDAENGEILILNCGK